MCIRDSTVTFVNEAFGTGLFSGGMNVLLWLSYIVMLSLYSQAFGSYAASLLPQRTQAGAKHRFMSAAVVLITVLNIAAAMYFMFRINWQRALIVLTIVPVLLGDATALASPHRSHLHDVASGRAHGIVLPTGPLSQSIVLGTGLRVTGATFALRALPFALGTALRD